MKQNFLIIVLLTNSIAVFSQAINSTISKNDLATCKIENEKLKQENEYLKKSLNILQPIKSVEQDGLEFKLIKCEGKIKEQNINLTFILTSHKANDEFQFMSAQTIDLQGNDFSTYEINLGNKGTRNTLFTDTPVQTKIVFNKVLPSTKKLKLLNIKYYGIGAFKEGYFEFKDLEVIWR